MQWIYLMLYFIFINFNSYYVYSFKRLLIKSKIKSGKPSVLSKLLRYRSSIKFFTWNWLTFINNKPSKYSQDEIVRIKFEANSKIEELLEARGAWVPPWLAAHVNQYQVEHFTLCYASFPVPTSWTFLWLSSICWIFLDSLEWTWKTYHWYSFSKGIELIHFKF